MKLWKFLLLVLVMFLFGRYFGDLQIFAKAHARGGSGHVAVAIPFNPPGYYPHFPTYCIGCQASGMPEESPVLKEKVFQGENFRLVIRDHADGHVSVERTTIDKK